MQSHESGRESERQRESNVPVGKRRLGDDDPLMPPAALLSRFNARQLNPAEAAILPGQRVRSTAYIADRLLARVDGQYPRSRDLLAQAAAGRGLRLVEEERPGGGEHGPLIAGT